MSNRLRFMATLVCLSLSLSTFAEEINFINDDLRAGLNRASSEGKLIFLEFWASYCTPCKMMEEYTFTNATVIDRLTNHYVPVKVNIQSLEGYDLKTQYKVTVLPTIIILDSKGRQVGRYEETMAPAKLSAVLDKYNVPQNRSRPAVFVANNAGTSAPINTVTNVAPSTVPVSTTPRTVPIGSGTTNMPRRTAVIPPTPNTVAEVGQRREIPVTGFTIQAGAYGLAASAQIVMDEMKSKIGNQKQFIMQSKSTSGKMTFRILIGSFASRQEADNYRKQAAIEGYVRSFGDFAKK
jgi:thioredoxin-related protein